jgi:hypothetical protein
MPKVWTILTDVENAGVDVSVHVSEEGAYRHAADIIKDWAEDESTHIQPQYRAECLELYRTGKYREMVEWWNEGMWGTTDPDCELRVMETDLLD